MTAIIDMNKHKGAILLIGILHSFGNEDSCTLLFALCVKMIDSFNKGRSNLLLEVTEGLHKKEDTTVLEVLDF